jgi:sec-independent protein translocase protein TatA
MGTFSIWHILVVLVVILVLFGKGRISAMMEDLGKGIKSFKKGMAEDESPQKQITKKEDGTDQ